MPAQFLDARAVLNVLDTVQFEARLVEELDKRGLQREVVDREVPAYLNHGRWLADCPRCNNGMALLEGERAVCIECGGSYAVDWPTPARRTAAARVLGFRDQRSSWNWRPGEESVEDLKAENALRGVRF